MMVTIGEGIAQWLEHLTANKGGVRLKSVINIALDTIVC